MLQAPYIKVSVQGGVVHMTGQAQWRRCPSGLANAADIGEPFAEWSWRDNRLTFTNDPYGLIPVFYAEVDGGLIVSPDLMTVLNKGAPRALDDAALAVFLRLGWFLENDTPFAAIKTMPSGARLEWRSGRMTLRGGPKKLSSLAVTPDQAVKLLHDRFQAAISRRRELGQRPLILPLSGGKDSRLILFELMRQGVRPQTCVSVCPEPPRANEDVVIAQDLAQVLGLPWQQLPFDGSPARREQRKNRYTHFLTDEHAWFMPLADLLNTEGGVTFDGIGMDVFLNCYLANEPRMDWAYKGDARAIAFDLLKGRDHWVRHLLQPEIYERMSHEVAMERVISALNNHLDAPHPIADFQFWSRTRREIALSTLALYDERVCIRMPFLDAEVFEVGAALPADVTFGQKLREKWLATHYQDYPQLRYAGADKTLRAFSAGYNRRYARDLLPHILAKMVKLGGVMPVNRGRLLAHAVKAFLTGQQRDLDWLDPAKTLWLMDVCQMSNGLRPSAYSAADKQWSWGPRRRAPA